MNYIAVRRILAVTEPLNSIRKLSSTITRKRMEEEEKMELSHEPVPGYRKAFFIAITIGVLYLATILFNTI